MMSNAGFIQGLALQERIRQIGVTSSHNKAAPSHDLTRRNVDFLIKDIEGVEDPLRRAELALQLARKLGDRLKLW